MKLAILLLAIALSACGERWDAFVYPDRGDLSTHQFAGQHDSLEACRLAAADVISGLPQGQQTADYECGLNCRDGSGLKICERTERS